MPGRVAAVLAPGGREHGGKSMRLSDSESSHQLFTSGHLVGSKSAPSINPGSRTPHAHSIQHDQDRGPTSDVVVPSHTLWGSESTSRVNKRLSRLCLHLVFESPPLRSYTAGLMHSFMLIFFSAFGCPISQMKFKENL